MDTNTLRSTTLTCDRLLVSDVESDNSVVLKDDTPGNWGSFKDPGGYP